MSLRAARSMAAAIRRHAPNKAFSSVTKPLPEVNLSAIESRASSHEQEFATAVKDFYEDESPVVLRQAAARYPAIEKWKRLDYLVETIDNAVFEVEMGMYNVGQRAPLPFNDYAAYMELFEAAKDTEKEGLPRLYLAQNDLPKSLLADFGIPQMCNDASLGVGNGRLYNTHLWMGPEGCKSCLHFDPLDNFLMQIVGRKRVFLLDTKIDTSLLYVGTQGNTSGVDVENPNYAQHPRFKDVPPALTAELFPGDILFIPKQWWHATSSLTYSISVNAWWR